MKTSVVMFSADRELFGIKIRQQSKTGHLNPKPNTAMQSDDSAIGFYIDPLNPEPQAIADAIGADALINFMRILAKADVEIAQRKLSSRPTCSTYLMVDSKTGFYKIGKSQAPEYRERTLQSEAPTIKMIASCEVDIEGELHKKYASQRIRGEWFGLKPKQVAAVLRAFATTRNVAASVAQ